MDEKTRRIRHALAGPVAVAQFDRTGWVDDPDALDAGFHATSFDDCAVGDGPGAGPYLAGPGRWDPAFETDQAWRTLGIQAPMTVDYRPGNPGNDQITVMIDTRDASGKQLSLTLGINDKLGLFGDPDTIRALGGTPGETANATGADDTEDTLAPRNVGNLARAGVDQEERDRIWEALNALARTHPASVLWHEDGAPGRDLPHHTRADARIGHTMPGNTPPTPVEAPAPAGDPGRSAGAERSAAVSR